MMVTINGEKAHIEVDERSHGQTEVNACISEGAYTVASFASPKDAEQFADFLKQSDRSYKTENYRLIDGE